MTFYPTCQVGVLIGEDVAYNLGSLIDTSIVASVLTGGGSNDLNVGSIVSLSITNPLIDPMIALVTFTVPSIRYNGSNADAGSIEAERSAAFYLDGAFVSSFTSRSFGNVVPQDIVSDGETFTGRFILAGGQSILAEITDFVNFFDDGSPVSPSYVPVRVALSNWSISATGWLQQ